MPIECMVDDTGEDYYDVDYDTMQRIKAVLEHLSTDGALLTPELIQEAKELHSMFNKDI